MCSDRAQDFVLLSLTKRSGRVHLTALAEESSCSAGKSAVGREWRQEAPSALRAFRSPSRAGGSLALSGWQLTGGC